MKTVNALRSDKKGYYYRNLGWIRNRGETSYGQPKFLLGRDAAPAGERLRRLELLWGLVEKHHRAEYGEDERAVWDDRTLEIAKAIARGETIYRLPRQNQPGQTEEEAAWADADYAGYMRSMQLAYPVITFLAEDESALENGVQHNLRVAQQWQALADDFAHDAGRPSVRNLDETLHKAVQAFVDRLAENPKYQNHATTPGAQPLTSWAYKLRTACLDFLERYEDRPLTTLESLESVQSLYDYWRRRPKSRLSGHPITVKTARNRMVALTQFLKWLHKTDQFSWRKPADFDEIEKTVKETAEERAAKARTDQTETFTEEELLLLYRNTTTPIERLLMLLGLNCGFKAAEAGSLLISEIFLEQAHPEATLLDYLSSDGDSFIKRIRQKTGVYAEYKLWPHTALGLKWALDRRIRQTIVTSGDDKGQDIRMTSTSILLTNKTGYPMYRVYRSGNTSQDIPKCWTRVIERAAAERLEMAQHSYRALRNTAANFIRRSYGGEVANLFISHGSPFEQDRLLECYTNRPFGRLFAALDELGDRLRPMFESVVQPFPAIEKRGGANISPSKIREIKNLLADGRPKTEVAKCAGVHISTVYRYAK